MPRRRATYRLDDRVIEALKQPGSAGSTNKLVETILWQWLQGSGRIPASADRLPETRGGRRVKQKEEESDRD
jgi:hypothetical protein